MTMMMHFPHPLLPPTLNEADADDADDDDADDADDDNDDDDGNGEDAPPTPTVAPRTQ